MEQLIPHLNRERQRAIDDLPKDAEHSKRIKEELADVFAYALLLAEKHQLNVSEIVLEKIQRNGEKYPIEKSKGNAQKYSEL